MSAQVLRNLFEILLILNPENSDSQTVQGGGKSFWSMPFSWLPLVRALPFLVRRDQKKRKQKGLVPMRNKFGRYRWSNANKFGRIVVPNKAIASNRLRPNPHAFFFATLGKEWVLGLLYRNSYLHLHRSPSEIAVPVLRSLSLYCDGLLKFLHNDIFILVKHTLGR